MCASERTGSTRSQMIQHEHISSSSSSPHPHAVASVAGCASDVRISTACMRHARRQRSQYIDTIDSRSSEKYTFFSFAFFSSKWAPRTTIHRHGAPRSRSHSCAHAPIFDGSIYARQSNIFHQTRPRRRLCVLILIASKISIVAV